MYKKWKSDVRSTGAYTVSPREAIIHLAISRVIFRSDSSPGLVTIMTVLGVSHLTLARPAEVKATDSIVIFNRKNVEEEGEKTKGRLVSCPLRMLKENSKTANIAWVGQNKKGMNGSV